MTTDDDVWYFVAKKNEALKCLISQEADSNTKESKWYRNLAIERMQFDAIPLHFANAEARKRALQDALAKGILDHFDEYVRQVEDSVFDGVFSADEIEKKLQLVVFSEHLNTMQSENIEVLHHNPYRDTVVDVFNKAGMQNLANKIATGQQTRDAVSLTEKKNYYQEVFNEMSETIFSLKGYMREMQGVIPSDNRISSLLERYEWCEQVISRTRTVVRDF